MHTYSTQTKALLTHSVTLHPRKQHIKALPQVSCLLDSCLLQASAHHQCIRLRTFSSAHTYIQMRMYMCLICQCIPYTLPFNTPVMVKSVPVCNAMMAPTSLGPARVTAAAFWAMTLATMSTTAMTATSGAKGAVRMTTLGNFWFSAAPSTTGTSTTWHPDTNIVRVKNLGSLTDRQ